MPISGINAHFDKKFPDLHGFRRNAYIADKSQFHARTQRVSVDGRYSGNIHIVDAHVQFTQFQKIFFEVGHALTAQGIDILFHIAAGREVVPFSRENHGPDA